MSVYATVSVDTKTFETVIHGIVANKINALVHFENDRLEVNGKIVDNTHFTVKHLIDRHDILFQLIEW